MGAGARSLKATLEPLLDPPMAPAAAISEVLSVELDVALVPQPIEKLAVMMVAIADLINRFFVLFI